MVWKILSPCTSSTKKVSLTIKTDYVLGDTRDVNQHWQLRAVWGEWVNLVFARLKRGLLSICVKSFVNKQVKGYCLEIIICPCYLYIYKCFVKILDKHFSTLLTADVKLDSNILNSIVFILENASFHGHFWLSSIVIPTVRVWHSLAPPFEKKTIKKVKAFSMTDGVINGNLEETVAYMS